MRKGGLTKQQISAKAKKIKELLKLAEEELDELDGTKIIDHEEDEIEYVDLTSESNAIYEAIKVVEAYI